MQGLDDDEKRQVLGEVLVDELKAIHDLVKDVPSISLKVNKIETDVESLKNDMKAVKAVVTEHSREIKSHRLRIAQL